ncbi:MAG: recombinase family protein [Tannerella sp.]|jgi:DNA invertase Pin-like site-specific DNA recombinase|nr:recombinase family protein [Tannerella sp.]
MSEVIVIKDNKNNEKIRKSAAYCRVRNEENEQSQSYTKQIQRYTDKFKIDPKYQLAEIYADRESGTKADNREEFQRMLTDCRKGKIDRIYAKSVSRFARNAKESLTILRELKSLGISVYFEKEELDTGVMSGEMMLTFYSIFAEEESKSIAINVQWGQKKRMIDGTFDIGTVPYGFRKENKKFVIYEPEAAIVRQIYDMYLNGIGTHLIADKLNQSGDKIWRNVAIRRILTNEVYYGDVFLGKHYTENQVYKTNKGERELYCVKNHDEPIVSKEIFDKVQNVMRNRGDTKGDGSLQTPFKQKVFCINSNRSFYAANCRETIRYNCGKSVGGAKYYDNCDDCEQKSYGETELTAAFITVVKKLKSNNHILHTAIRQLEMLDTANKSDNKAIVGIQIEIAKLREQHHAYSQLKMQDIIDEVIYQEQSNVIDMRLIECQPTLDRDSAQTA